MPAQRSSLRSWTVVIGGTFGILCVLILSFWGYDRWANILPAYRPVAPTMPSPNGYDRAVALLAHLPPEPSAQGALSKRWPYASPAALVRAVRPALPTLRALRGTFRMQWRRPYPVPFRGSPDYAQFRGCARYYVAASLMAEAQGDNSAAIQARLDDMEMGARTCRGGPLIALLVGVAIHAYGFAGVVDLVPHLPSAAIPDALARVRRIHRAWDPFPAYLETERTIELQETNLVWRADYHDQTPLDTLRVLWSQVSLDNIRNLRGTGRGIAAWLTPKRHAYDRLDKYLQSLVATYQVPYGQRRPVSVPTEAIFGDNLLQPSTVDWAEAKWWDVQTELSLLEVALAVRMHHLERGRYPVRLSGISHQWLPAVPLDPWGHPVVYRLKDGKPLIYSIGPDGKDNGGRSVSAVGLGSGTKGDLVFGPLLTRRK